MFKKKEKGFTISFDKFILEPKTITIDCSGHTTTFRGTSLQEDYTEYYNLVAEIESEIDEKRRMLKGLAKSGDVLNLQKTNQELKVLTKEKQKVVEKYFETKGNPLVMAFALQEYVTSEWKSLEKARTYYQSLPEAVRDLADIKLFGQRLSKMMKLAPGNKIPVFSLPDQDGRMISTNRFKGKFLLIDFWASWCFPCRKEAPNLVALHKKYKDRNFDILQVSFDENKKAWREAIEKVGYYWTNVIDSLGMSKSKVAELFNITALHKELTC